VINSQWIKTVERHVEYGIGFMALLSIICVNSHGRIPSLYHKLKDLPRSNSNLFVYWLVVHVKFLVLVDNHDGQVLFFWILDADDVVLLPAVFEFEGIEFEVIGQ
jgi:hypothetical protein